MQNAVIPITKLTNGVNTKSEIRDDSAGFFFAVFFSFPNIVTYLSLICVRQITTVLIRLPTVPMYVSKPPRVALSREADSVALSTCVPLSSAVACTTRVR